MPKQIVAISILRADRNHMRRKLEQIKAVIEEGARAGVLDQHSQKLIRIGRLAKEGLQGTDGTPQEEGPC